MGALPALGLLDKCPTEERGLRRMTGFVVVEGKERDSGISMADSCPCSGASSPLSRSLLASLSLACRYPTPSSSYLADPFFPCSGSFVFPDPGESFLCVRTLLLHWHLSSYSPVGGDGLRNLLAGLSLSSPSLLHGSSISEPL